ncbi:MAG: lysophospholipid acyltransferase family protein [Nitrococcus sp.]|nr:lysophospholipid acyltransferase family protein [Nitrococcus sp.]
MAHYYLLPRRFSATLRCVRPLIWRLESWLVALILCVLRLLPLSLASRLAGWCFERIGPHTPRAQKVRQNLAVAFPGQNPFEAERLLRNTFRYVGVAMVELVQLPQIWRRREQRIEFVLEPGAVTPAAELPCVFVTAHVGAWQLAPLVGPNFGVTIPIIHAPEENPYVDRLFRRMRSAWGGPLVVSDGGVREAMRSLNQGHSIGLAIDTRLDSGAALPFFGEDALTNTVPARLALRYGCDMVPVLAERLPNERYRIRIFPPVRPRADSMGANDQVKDMIVQLNQRVERWIQARPGEWFCMKQRWPKATIARYCAEDRDGQLS